MKGYTKKELIRECKDTMKSDLYNYEDFIFDLVEETLKTRTKKQLLNILGCDENCL